MVLISEFIRSFLQYVTIRPVPIDFYDGLVKQTLKSKHGWAFTSHIYKSM